MSNEYVVSESSLISVADSIRTKCDTSDPLVFPDGFVTAIQDISELNFEVVGGTIQPENPKENMIWVNTDQEITGWAFSVEEPKELYEGMVWISTTNDNRGVFNAIKENSIIIYPSMAMQYISGKLVKKDAKIYQNENWIDLVGITYLYNRGDECTNKTGGWVTGGYTGGTIKSGTKESDRMSFVGEGLTNVVLGTAKAINLTDISTVRVIGEITQNLSDRSLSLYFYVLSSQSLSSPQVSVQAGNMGSFNMALDVSNLTGSYYILCGAHQSGHCQGYVTEVYIE